MKRPRTFEPFPILLLLLQLIQEGSVPASTNKNPARGGQGIGWTQSRETCGQYARPPVLGEIELNSISLAVLFTQLPSIYQISATRRSSLCAYQREETMEHNARFHIPTPDWHWKAQSNCCRSYHGNTEFPWEEEEETTGRLKKKNNNKFLVQFCEN